MKISLDATLERTYLDCAGSETAARHERRKWKPERGKGQRAVSGNGCPTCTNPASPVPADGPLCDFHHAALCDAIEEMLNKSQQ